MGRLAKAMYGARGALQIWAKEVNKDVVYKRDMQTFEVAHVDDFLCIEP